jgi:HPt (histidine-containing phosphotransfer) domain-containing protein
MDPEAPLVDEAVLGELRASVGGDRSFLVDLVGTYLGDAESHLAAIAAAVTLADAQSLIRPAHTLKSSSATVGALRVSGIARELEVLARVGTVDDAAGAALERLRAAWPPTQRALGAWADEEGQ